MKSNTTTILVAAGALLVGGVATAAFMNNRPSSGDFVANGQPAPRGLEYADVVKVAPITQREPQYAQVINSNAIRETTTSTSPREVCRDVVVQERLPERDGNVGGTVAGAVIGGLIGNQVGGGNGRKLATAAGAVGGGFIGNRIDRNHVGGRVVDRTERQCHTENANSQSSRVVGYDVTYRNADGTTGTMRMDSKPGERISLGDADNVVAYDVTYRYDGFEKTVRMNDKPTSDRLPVVDGQLVTQMASTAGDSNVPQDGLSTRQ
ncbi:glycine zipper 2TM domain-containing protein [Xanthomonas euvesicatoria]|uniref:glycine zipper 2TM domain-containing protein n=1 Tax=Xanthomonas euvesicatoria TaxID=456327 RepID=UPI001C4440AC|nr:glycine zipper 2TM domain-containing protein [Xanthomonas euvesicatoria]MBV6798474.1 glycine zipper 2TM domain-containing protein [Xanthomonas campestris pv. obscurae]